MIYDYYTGQHNFRFFWNNYIYYKTNSHHYDDSY